MTDVLNFWFPNDNFNKFWFDKSKDSMIKMEYDTILNFVEKEVIEISRYYGIFLIHSSKKYNDLPWI